MKTLRIARIEVEFVVRAETDEEAREIAYGAWDDETITVNSLDFEIMPMRYYPAGWSKSTLVYGDHPEDLTVEACIAAGEAPEYKPLKLPEGGGE
jgi:hypothetical protein